MSGRPITDFIDDNNIGFILGCWLKVRSEAATLQDWEPELVRDAERIFGPYEEWGLSGRPITGLISDKNTKFILARWIEVMSGSSNLKGWEPDLVHDVERIFG